MPFRLAEMMTPLCMLYLSLLMLPHALASKSVMSAARPSAIPASRRVPPEGYYDPHKGGGNTLTIVNNTFPEGLGEPLNAIISGASDPAVLINSQDNGGLVNFFLSIGFAPECLGQSSGSTQSANLGDGRKNRVQTSLMRWAYGDPILGSCKESVMGGNHFRYWVQNGSLANSGAIFMAASYEMSAKFGHDIIPNGYNLGRDYLVGNITNQAVPTLQLGQIAEYSTLPALTTSENYTYQTTVRYVSGLLGNTSDGINHYLTVSVDGAPAIDGLVAVLKVAIVGRPSSSASIRWRPSPVVYGSILCVSLLSQLSPLL